MGFKQHGAFVLSLIASAMVAACCCSGVTFAADSQALDLNQVLLAAPSSEEARQYLGIGPKRLFPLSDISTRFIVLGYYGIECPYCHEQAPVSNGIYEMIRSDPELESNVKMVGVLVGSNPEETAAYAGKYHIQYPMANDPFFEIYRRLNKPKVPLTLLLNNQGEILVSVTGAMNGPEGFVRKLKQFQRDH